MSSRKAPIHVLDGGLGTTLQDIFHTKIDGASRPLWSSHMLISDPKTLQAAQRAFAKAGAEVILTDTYEAAFESFARTIVPPATSGIAEREAAVYMRSAVGIARASFKPDAVEEGDAGKTRGVVALSLGPYGSIMSPGQEYTGRYDTAHRTADELAGWHSNRLAVFKSDAATWDNVDIVAFETIPLLAEISAAREVMTGVERPFWISCVFPAQELTLPDGTAVERVVNAMLAGKQARPIAIGLNCTKTWKVSALIRQMEEAISRLVESRAIDMWPALVLYPDGTNGEVYNTTTQQWEVPIASGEGGENPAVVLWDELMFNIVRDTREKDLWSAIYVGGCCRTTPDMIKILKERLDTLSS